MAVHERHERNTSTATRSPAATPHRCAAAGPIRSITPDGLMTGDEWRTEGDGSR